MKGREEEVRGQLEACRAGQAGHEEVLMDGFPCLGCGGKKIGA